MTYGELYQEGLRALTEARIEEAAVDARILLEDICGTNRNDLLVHPEKIVSIEQIENYRNWIERRGTRIPLQHITQKQEFMGLSFRVNEHVLIPRQDTEILVEAALKKLHDGSKILDMCTGSGCILISLLKYTNDCCGTGADISEKALEVARINAQEILTGKEDDTHWEFIQSDLFHDLEGSFDMVVSNPPYIPTDVIPTLMEEVRIFEPMNALDGKEDGLYFYQEILNQCNKFLKKGGSLYFEIGYDQGRSVSELMKDAGFTEIEIIKDYAGLDRVVCGKSRVLSLSE